MSKDIINKIQYFWNNKEDILQDTNKRALALETVLGVLPLLNSGAERSCYKDGDNWLPNLWVKQAILVLFSLLPSKAIAGSHQVCCDKISARYSSDGAAQELLSKGIRVVPGSYIRDGVFIGQGSIIMPAFINTGSYIGEKVMIDSMVTIGSCAYIGNKCHISSGVTIGGVLEPINDNPVVIEEECFIGAGSQIVEGVVISKGSVLGAGTIITKSTKIYDAQTGGITYGVVPPYSVVVPGSLPLSSNGQVRVNCAVITKMVNAELRSRLTINDILREHT